MLAARFVLKTSLNGIGHQIFPVPKTASCSGRLQQFQRYASQPRGTYGRTTARRRTLKETLMAPATDTAFTIGKGAVAGASAFGIGALCYYGIGLSNEVGAIDKVVIWPEYVRDRIKSTYLYFGGSVAITAASAISVFQSKALLSMMMKNSWLAIAATLGAMIGSGMIARSLPYEKGFGKKQLAWMVHSGVCGAVIAPLCLLGGPLLIRAACYTAGIVGGLSLVAACAPSEKFLTMGGPLAIGLGVVFASSLGSMFLPPATALGAGLYSISLYGGLILFSGFLLYDTQRIIKKAELYPYYGVYPYDPVNASISIYLDTLNIFVRIVQILAGGGSRRK
uniref:Growth hormone-inducible transmembrane protein n=1 Tax=Scolopendra viridis TaxID=118503 RepID=A0A4D5RAN9_SCOVI